VAPTKKAIQCPHCGYVMGEQRARDITTAKNHTSFNTKARCNSCDKRFSYTVRE